MSAEHWPVIGEAVEGSLHEQLPGCLPQGFNLDSMLTVEEFCIWQRVSREWFTDRPRLKGVAKQTRQMVRIHPRTYLDQNVKGI